MMNRTKNCPIVSRHEERQGKTKKARNRTTKRNVTKI